MYPTDFFFCFTDTAVELALFLKYGILSIPLTLQ